MSDARDTAPETPSGEALDTAPAESEEGRLLDGREPYDADGVVEPERDDDSSGDELDDPDGTGTDDIAAEPLDDDQR